MATTNYIQWLVSYSGLLGPVAGIMIADYFLVAARGWIRSRCTAAKGRMSIARASIRAHSSRSPPGSSPRWSGS